MFKDLSFKEFLQRFLLTFFLILSFGILFWKPYEKKQQPEDSTQKTVVQEKLETYNNAANVIVTETNIAEESRDTTIDQYLSNYQDTVETDSIIKWLPLSHICSDLADPYCIARIRTAVYLELKFEIEVSKIIERNRQLFYPLTQENLDKIAYNSAPEIAKE